MICALVQGDQVLRRMRSISVIATPQTCATWAAVMPYFTQVRIRANSDRRILRADDSDATGGTSGASLRSSGVGKTICRTRGLRLSAAGSGTDGEFVDGLDVKSASATLRALVIRSRSSPRGFDCLGRLLGKRCSEWLAHLRFSQLSWLISKTWEAGS